MALLTDTRVYGRNAASGWITSILFRQKTFLATANCSRKNQEALEVVNEHPV